jgi:predicted Zn-dependent protease
VLDSRELKAFALPGGYLYVTSGVLGAAQTESELAGVLAREIARIAARHATRRTRMSFLPKLFVPAAQIVAGLFTGGPANPAAYYGVGYGVDGLGGLLGRALNGTDAKFQREADQLGIQYAWKAGYDPTGFVAFLDSISSVRAEGLLTEEPPLPERLLEMFSELSYLPQQKSSIPASEEFDSLKQRIKESR